MRKPSKSLKLLEGYAEKCRRYPLSEGSPMDSILGIFPVFIKQLYNEQ